MPITRSAKKAKRSADRKRSFNLARQERVTDSVKSVKKLIAGGKKKEAMAEFKKAQQALDKAAKEHTLDKNTASRKKSRLSKMIKKIK